MKRTMLTAASLSIFMLLTDQAVSQGKPEPRKWVPLGEFAVAPEAEATRERVLNTVDFVYVSSLAANDADAKLSTKVGHLSITFESAGSLMGATCTGSLIGEDLFLTNHHCVVDDRDNLISAAGLAVDMDYLRNGERGGPDARSGVTEILAIDKELDFALLKLSEPLGKTRGWLAIETDPNAVRLERAVKIVQHPAGRPKQLVRKNTEIVRTSGPALHYLADTEGGSSGSPVFGLNGEKIIALHHVGTYDYNEGILMTAIYPRISQFIPVGAATNLVVATAASAPANAPAPAPPAAAPVQRAEPQGGWTPIGN